MAKRMDELNQNLSNSRFQTRQEKERLLEQTKKLRERDKGKKKVYIPEIRSYILVHPDSDPKEVKARFLEQLNKKV